MQGLVERVHRQLNGSLRKCEKFGGKGCCTSGKIVARLVQQFTYNTFGLLAMRNSVKMTLRCNAKEKLFVQQLRLPYEFQPVTYTTSGGSRKFWWGGFEAKTSKIRMSSPKLRLIFRPKSEIQTFFSPKIRWSPKKKK